VAPLCLVQGKSWFRLLWGQCPLVPCRQITWCESSNSNISCCYFNVHLKIIRNLLRAKLLKKSMFPVKRSLEQFNSIQLISIQRDRQNIQNRSSKALEILGPAKAAEATSISVAATIIFWMLERCFTDSVLIFFSTGNIREWFSKRKGNVILYIWM